MSERDSESELIEKYKLNNFKYMLRDEGVEIEGVDLFPHDSWDIDVSYDKRRHVGNSVTFSDKRENSGIKFEFKVEEGTLYQREVDFRRFEVFLNREGEIREGQALLNDIGGAEIQDKSGIKYLRVWRGGISLTFPLMWSD